MIPALGISFDKMLSRFFLPVRNLADIDSMFPVTGILN
jgi:hypothetical protein